MAACSKAARCQASTPGAPHSRAMIRRARLGAASTWMSIIGRANWWLPGWLGKILPVVHVESESADDPVDDVLPVNPGH